MEENAIYQLDLKQSYELKQTPELSTLKAVSPSKIVLTLLKAEIIDNNSTATNTKTFLLKANGQTIGQIVMIFKLPTQPRFTY